MFLKEMYMSVRPQKPAQTALPLSIIGNVEDLKWVAKFYLEMPAVLPLYIKCDLDLAFDETCSTCSLNDDLWSMYMPRNL